MSHEKREIQGVPSTAFTSTKWIDPRLQRIEKQEGLPALLLSDGTILVSPNAFISGAVHAVFQRTLNAEITHVKGTWVFIPDDEDLRFEE